MTLSGIIESKQEYRFRVTFTNFGTHKLSHILSQNVISIERPKMNYNVNTGTHTWLPIKVELRDDICSVVMQHICDQVKAQMINNGQIPDPDSYLFDILVETLDETGNVEYDKWLIKNCIVTSVDFGRNDFRSKAGIVMSMTVAYKYAKIV